MTKKDYIIIARAINSSSRADGSIDNHLLLFNLNKEFSQDNSKFDFARFATACGAEATKQ